MITIANALNVYYGVQTEFFVTTEDDPSYLEENNYRVTRCLHTADPIKQLTEAVKPSDGIIVLDSYLTTEEHLRYLGENRYRVAMIEDGCRLKFYPCDLVVDSGAGAHLLKYQGLAKTKFLLGPAYFPLKEEIRVEERSYITSGDVKNILVTLGGSDPSNLINSVLESLTQLEGQHEISAILGPFYKGKVDKKVTDNSQIKLIRSPKNIAHYFSHADIAISTAGNSASELAYLGVPSILFSLSEDQVPVAQCYDKMGIARHLQFGPNNLQGELNKQLSALINDRQARKQMKKEGMNLLDGRGAKRIATAINDLKYLDYTLNG